MSGLTLDALLEQSGSGPVDVLARVADRWEAVEVEPDERSLVPAVTPALAVLVAARAAESWKLDAMLRRIRDLGYTGVALPSETPITAGTAALSLRIGLTLLRAHRPTALARACWELTTGGDALMLVLVRKVAQTTSTPRETSATS